MPRQTPDQKKAALLDQQKRIAQQLRQLDARAKAQDRKDDARRKIIAGALALEHLDKNPDSPFAVTLKGLLNEYARDAERRLFPFIDQQQTA